MKDKFKLIYERVPDNQNAFGDIMGDDDGRKKKVETILEFDDCVTYDDLFEEFKSFLCSVWLRIVACGA